MALSDGQLFYIGLDDYKRGFGVNNFGRGLRRGRIRGLGLTERIGTRRGRRRDAPPSSSLPYQGFGSVSARTRSRRLRFPPDRIVPTLFPASRSRSFTTPAVPAAPAPSAR
jgi:hypothetical protein